MQSDTFGRLRSKFLRINIPISFWREVKTLPFFENLPAFFACSVFLYFHTHISYKPIQIKITYKVSSCFKSKE